MIVDDLKTSILNYAITGMFVKNSHNNFEEELKKIIEIKEKQIINKEVLISSKILSIEETPFELPQTWKWVRLGTVSRVVSKGTTPQGGKNAYQESGIKFLRAENVKDYKVDETNIQFILENVHNNFLKRSILEENDLLICIAGTLGRCGIVAKENLPLNTNQAVSFVRLVDPNLLNVKYIAYAISSPIIQNLLIDQKKITAIPNLTLETITNCLIPFPPLEEQNRIVEKIEELFVKLDETKIIENELNILKMNFSSEMKKSILFGAISGKLSVQNKNDTPVDNQLEKIKHESKKFYLINEIKNSRRKNHDYKFFTDDKYVIPATWKYVPLSSTCLSIFSGKSPKYVKHNNDNLILGQKVNQENGLHFEDLKYGTDEFIKSLPKYQFLIKNDVLLNTLGGGSVGRCGIFDNDIPNITTDGHIFVIRTAGFTNEKYIMYFLRLYREKLEDYANGTTNQKFFNIKQIEDIMIPLPPIEEQKRIVDKIEQLLPLCNEIEKLVNS